MGKPKRMPACKMKIEADGKEQDCRNIAQWIARVKVDSGIIGATKLIVDLPPSACCDGCRDIEKVKGDLKEVDFWKQVEAKFAGAGHIPPPESSMSVGYREI